jgi:hypothetical protein
MSVWNTGAATVQAGDVGLFSGVAPFTLEHRWRPQLSVVSFMIPRRALDGRLGGLEFAKPRVISNHPVFGALPPQSLLGLFDTLFDFTYLTFASNADGERGGPRSRTLLMALRAHIDRHFRHPSFDVARLAAVHGVSVHYVNKLFESHGFGETFGTI